MSKQKENVTNTYTHKDEGFLHPNITPSISIKDSFNVYNYYGCSQPEEKTEKSVSESRSREDTVRHYVSRLQKNPEDISALDKLCGLYASTAVGAMKMFAIPTCEWDEFRFVLLPLQILKISKRIRPKAGKSLDYYMRVGIKRAYWVALNQSNKTIRLDPRYSKLLAEIRQKLLQSVGTIDYEPLSVGLKYGKLDDELLDTWCKELKLSRKQLENAMEDLTLEEIIYLHPSDDDITPAFDQENLLPSEKENPENVILEREKKNAVHAAIHSDDLTPMERQILIMHYGLDDGCPKSLAEIQRVLEKNGVHMSATTVKRRHKSGLDKAKKHFLANKDREDEPF